METTRKKFIDTNETALRVRNFFDREFFDYLAKAGLSKTSLYNMNLDESGVPTRGKDTHEDNLIEIFDYESKCRAVAKAIETCTDNANLSIYNHTILYYLYLKDYTNEQVRQKVGFAGSTYRLKKRNALCEFADRLPVCAYRCHTEVPDLHRYDVL